MRKVKPSFKQIAFDTAVRNPERYVEFFKILIEFEGMILDDDIILDIMARLYTEEIVGTVININITDIDKLKNTIVQVNSSRNADGGFPKGYQSRFWTYMRTPSEFGLVYARYNKELRVSDIAKLYINGKISEEDLFSTTCMMYNRRSPYRNVSNDFNYFHFILSVLLILYKKNKSLTYNQFVISMFSYDGNVEGFLNILDNNKFSYVNTVTYIREHFSVKTKDKTIMREYPDVVLRILRITGLVTVFFDGVLKISINKDKLTTLEAILKINFKISESEKVDAKLYFEKLNTSYEIFFKYFVELKSRDLLQNYNIRLANIIKRYGLDEETIIKCIMQIGKRQKDEFSYIPVPLQLEFFIALLVYTMYCDRLTIKPNYTIDDLGMPVSHAPSRKGDIEVYSNDIFWLIEVTLITNKRQQINTETTAVIRHFENAEEFKTKLNKFLSFVAPIIHEDTLDYYNYTSDRLRKQDSRVYIKTYNIDNFIKVTRSMKNFEDMRAL